MEGIGSYYPSEKEFIEKAKLGNLIPVYKEILADLETPVSAFTKIDEGDYSYLLESVEGGEKIARYSFLGANPSLILKSKGKEIEIIERDQRPATLGRSPRYKVKRFTVEAGPLAKIKEIMNGFKFVKVEGLPRFCGGLVGYMGYDVVRFFEKLPDENPDDLDLPDCWFVLTDTILIFDHIDHKIKIVSNVLVEGDPKETYRRATTKIDRLIKRLRQPLTASKRLKSKRGRHPKGLEVKSNFTQGEFKAIVRRAKEYIMAGDAIQIVLSQRFEVQLRSHPFDVYRALRSINPSPYMYYLRYKDLTLVGTSPEILVRCEDGVVETRPIAGTRPRGEDASKDKLLVKELLSDPKEAAEHIMLVDLGRNDVGRVCEYGSVHIPEIRTIEKYSHVMHIVSDVIGKKTQDKDIFDVLQASFPAGTVTGAPKIRAMEIIDELETTRRGPYAGMVGYFSFSGNLDSCITIRTLIIKGTRAYVQAGAGIVADSDPDREFEETQNKARALISAVEMAWRGLE